MTTQITNIFIPDALEIDMECDTLEEAYTVAEAFTKADFEVTKPLDVDGKFCIRAVK